MMRKRQQSGHSQLRVSKDKLHIYKCFYGYLLPLFLADKKLPFKFRYLP